MTWSPADRRGARKMVCSRIQSFLSAYADGELPPRLRQEVEQHLAACELCSAEVLSLRRLARLTSLVPEEEVPTGLHARILTSLASAPPPRAPYRPPGIAAWLVPALGCTGVALAIGALQASAMSPAEFEAPRGFPAVSAVAPSQAPSLNAPRARHDASLPAGRLVAVREQAPAASVRPVGETASPTTRVDPPSPGVRTVSAPRAVAAGAAASGPFTPLPQTPATPPGALPVPDPALPEETVPEAAERMEIAADDRRGIVKMASMGMMPMKSTRPTADPPESEDEAVPPVDPDPGLSERLGRTSGTL